MRRSACSFTFLGAFNPIYGEVACVLMLLFYLINWDSKKCYL